MTAISENYTSSPYPDEDTRRYLVKLDINLNQDKALEFVRYVNSNALLLRLKIPLSFKTFHVISLYDPQLIIERYNSNHFYDLFIEIYEEDAKILEEKDMLKDFLHYQKEIIDNAVRIFGKNTEAWDGLCC